MYNITVKPEIYTEMMRHNSYSEFITNVELFADPVIFLMEILSYIFSCFENYTVHHNSKLILSDRKDDLKEMLFQCIDHADRIHVKNLARCKDIFQDKTEEELFDTNVQQDDNSTCKKKISDALDMLISLIPLDKEPEYYIDMFNENEEFRYLRDKIITDIFDRAWACNNKQEEKKNEKTEY
jgi:hypothetical protein